MEREEALLELLRLKGQNLHDLAREFEVTVIGPQGKQNKGWAGHVIERYFGLPLNSAQSPNFGSWELKVISLYYTKKRELRFKETMAITMIDQINVRDTAFEDSHLLTKLRKAVIVARTVGSHVSEPSYVHSASLVSIDQESNKELYEIVKGDYDEVRDCIKNPNRGFDQLTGKMGRYIQPRTKGQGHGSKSRAFYARKEFLSQVIDLSQDTLA